MRQCGILLPLFSLPGPGAMGAMGPAAHAFIHRLAWCGQSVWQLLPLYHTRLPKDTSPYSALSSFALEPGYLDWEELCRHGLLTPEQLPVFEGDESLADYRWVSEHTLPVLRLAYGRFVPEDGYRDFCRRERDWLTPYAAFMALRERFGSLAWHCWPAPWRRGDDETLAAAEELMPQQLDFWRFVQYQLHRQWQAVRCCARQNGVALWGDLPIYVSLDSADVWRNRTLFDLDESGRPRHVAGCPPDAFAPDGQLWGNPLYDWDAMERDGFDWWARRLERAMELFDRVRLDHFRGLAGYYRCDARAKTARQGQWLPGPGMALLTALKKRLGALPLVAEDLGFLTEDVHQLLSDSGLPGMKVLQFAFDGSPDNPYLPSRLPENCVAFTGTHDNDTLCSWLSSLSDRERQTVCRLLDLPEGELTAADLRQSLLASPARTVLIPLADYLERDGSGRINTPGTVKGNWRWRLTRDEFSPKIGKQIHEEALQSGRARP